MFPVVVQWFGPYTYDAAAQEKDPGIYFVWGRNRRGRSPSAPKMLYVGISENANGVGQRVKQHRTKDFNHADNHWYIGRVRTPTGGGREALCKAEWLLAWYMQFERNEKLKASPPKEACLLLNEWLKADGGLRVRQMGAVAVIPDFIAWDPDSGVVRSSQQLDMEWIGD